MIQVENEQKHKKIIVTGGSGMVGHAIKWVIENDMDPRFGNRENEEWIFLGSKDGDLK
jgi:GDP-L-fucose synthase